jgi:hypothetical protein
MSFVLAALALGACIEDCPAVLELKSPKLRTSEQAVIQSYADCMSIPNLPVGDELKARRARCAALRSTASAAGAEDILEWVDHIAANFPGCETRLRFSRK